MYKDGQKTCKNVQLCTAENTTGDANATSESVCLDHLSRARKSDGNGYMFRVVVVGEGTVLMQSVDSGLCFSNAGDEVFMGECDEADLRQVLDVGSGVNGLRSGDFVLRNGGLCLGHAGDTDEPSLFVECDAAVSGVDWRFLDRDGDSLELF